MKRALLLALALSLASAAAFAQDATVYVYRYRLLVDHGVKPTIYCDGTKLARLVNGRYFAVSVKPGMHLFRSIDEQSVAAINARPGGQYFVRAYYIFGSAGLITLVDPDSGRAELSTGKLKPLDKDEVIATDIVSIDPVHFNSEAAEASASAK